MVSTRSGARTRTSPAPDCDADAAGVQQDVEAGVEGKVEAGVVDLGKAFEDAARAAAHGNGGEGDGGAKGGGAQQPGRADVEPKAGEASGADGGGRLRKGRGPRDLGKEGRSGLGEEEEGGDGDGGEEAAAEKKTGHEKKSDCGNEEEGDDSEMEGISRGGVGKKEESGESEMEEESEGGDGDEEADNADAGKPAGLSASSSSEAWVKFASEAAEKPGLFMTRGAAATSVCRALLKLLYDEQAALEHGADLKSAARRKRKRARGRAPLGPLARIDVSDVFEVEQVWEELELRNGPLTPFLEREVGRALRRVDAKKRKREGENAVVDVDGGMEKVGAGAVEPDADGIDAGDGGEEGPEAEKDASEGEDDDASEPSPKKVRFSVEEGSDVDSGEGPKDSGVSGNIEDGFFSLADMEAFGNEAEELAADGKLMEDSDGENTGNDLRDGGESEDDDDEGLGLSQVGKHKGTSSQTEERIRYADFFDKPGGEQGRGGKASDESDRALRRATMFDEGSSDDEGEEGDAKTPLDLEREKLRDSISELENANVSKKPWQLRGEVDAHGRPMNSLLESEFEHDIVARPRVAPTAASAASIEDIIRQRVFDGLFDDPVRKLPADYEDARKKKQRAPPAEISQEKPEEGLAELYEREFAEEREKVSKAGEAASQITVREADPEDNPEQAEVNRLFKRLSNKLDALASLHFTPAPPKMPAEMEVKPNVPALNAEEAIPEAVSDAALLAPREVHTAGAEDLQGEVETDKLERRARRRTKKRHISKDNKRKDGDEQKAEMADPALAEQRRAERTLQRPGKMLKAVANPNDRNKSKKKRDATFRSLEDVGSKTGDFAKSTRFFTQLQDTVHQDLAGKKSKMDAREVSNGASAASLKL